MVADRQAEAGDQPHPEEQADFDRPNRPTGEQTECDQRTGKRQNIEDDEMPSLQLVKASASDHSRIAHAHMPAALLRETVRSYSAGAHDATDCWSHTHYVGGAPMTALAMNLAADTVEGPGPLIRLPALSNTTVALAGRFGLNRVCVR